MSAPPVDNKTGFAAHPQLLLDKDGEKLAVVVKATFEAPHDASAPLELAAKGRRRGIRFADVPWDAEKPEKSSLAFAADLCLRKPGTDVVVAATGYAPGGKAVPAFDVYVQAGPARRLLRVHGLRVWERGGAGISQGRPIAELPIRYEHAWGGFDDSDPEHLVEEARNPVGMGVARDPAALTDQRAPQIEDAAQPVLTAKTWPQPAGLGPIGRHWEPRRRFTGTYDDLWLDLRAPLTPLDQDDRVNLVAPPGLTVAPYLRGGEQFAMLNLVPGGGPLAFPLPVVGLRIEFKVQGRETIVVAPPIDTVVVDLFGIGPEQPIAVELVWRAYVKAPRKMNEAKITIREARA